MRACTPRFSNGVTHVVPIDRNSRIAVRRAACRRRRHNHCPDGRQVLLRDNGTWSVVEESDTPDTRSYASLTVEKKFDMPRGCKFGLRLQNDLSAQIRSLVLRFTAYKGDQIPFETVTRGYSYIKPTASQYRE